MTLSFEKKHCPLMSVYSEEHFEQYSPVDVAMMQIEDAVEMHFLPDPMW